MADEKLSNLTERTEGTLADALYVVDDLIGTPGSSRMALDEVGRSAGIDGIENNPAGDYVETFPPAGEDNAWTWANQGTSTLLQNRLGTILTPEVPAAANDLRVRWAGPTLPASPWIWLARVGHFQGDDAGSQVGIVALTGGSEATPTQLFMQSFTGSHGSPSIALQRFADYQTFQATIAQPGLDEIARLRGMILGIEWDGTSIHGWYSQDGTSWRNVGSNGTGPPVPSNVGIVMNDSGSAGDVVGFFQWAKLVDLTNINDLSPIWS